MRSSVRLGSVIWVGAVSLAMLAGGGCGGEANEEGISNMESTVAPDAPGSMEDYYNQQMQGGAAAEPTP